MYKGVFHRIHPVIYLMPNIKTGREVPCFICGKLRYRTAAYLARDHKKITCGNWECKSKAMQGENNPFWGKIHDEQTRLRIREGRRARPPRGTGPPKGFRHTSEAREKIRLAMIQRWTVNRDLMLANLAHLRRQKPLEELRYRRNFSEAQRREWLANECYWCKGTHTLVLDHIIPVSCGGLNERRNAQTLCRSCNLWKMAYVDRPLFLAGLGSKEG